VGFCKAMSDPGHEVCGEETPEGYAYCEEHRDRPRAIKEQRKVESRAAKSEVAEITSKTVTGMERQIMRAVSQRPVEDLTAHALLEKVTSMIHRVIEFEDIAAQKVNDLGDDWRYIDKAGAEQLRAEVQVYERALDRSARVLSSVAKLGIDAQLANANRTQIEILKTVMTKALTRLNLTPEQMREARDAIAEEFDAIAWSA